MESFAEFDPVPRSDILNAIYNTSMFAGIDPPELRLLADKSILQSCKADEILIEQGEVGDKLYIIVKGKMLISVKDLNLGQRKVNILGPGDIFGEIAILRKIPRTARVTSLTRCDYLTINAQDFFAAYQYFPAKARDNIQLVIAKRLEQLGQRV